MPTKLLAIDLDRTLLSEERTISPRAAAALQKAADRGVQIVFCTGRRYRSTLPFVRQVSRTVLVAYNNGAVVRVSADHKVVIKNLFPQELFTPVLRLLSDFGLLPVIHIDMFEEGIDLYFKADDPNPFHRAYVERNRDFLRVVSDFTEVPAGKVIQLIVIERLDRLGPVKQAAEALEGAGELNIHIVKNFGMPAGCLEVLGKRGSKWDAVIQVARGLGLEAKDIVAVGDDISDVALVANAGIGVAVENAVEEVKEVADFIVPSNAQDGAAFAIERFVL